MLPPPKPPPYSWGGSLLPPRPNGGVAADHKYPRKGLGGLPWGLGAEASKNKAGGLGGGNPPRSEGAKGSLTFGRDGRTIASIQIAGVSRSPARSRGATSTASSAGADEPICCT